MSSRFHPIPERHGQTDGRTDKIAISNFSSLGAFKRSLQLVNFDEFLQYSLID